MELTHTVSVFAAGTFGEDDIVASVLYFFCYILDDSQRLTHVFTVHKEGFCTLNDLLDEGNSLQFLFQYGAQRCGAGGGNGDYVKQTLMIAIHHKAAAGGGDILNTRNDQIHIAGFDCQLENMADVIPALLLRIRVGIFGIAAELPIQIRYPKQIAQYHQ